MPSQPNILFIFPDQWRADALSCLDHPTVLTPHLDELAWQGTTFTNAQSNCPLCIPVRACMITGQTPNTVGRFGWKQHISFEPYRTTLMRCLRDAGYQTMLAGKTHFFPRRISLGFEQMALSDPWWDYRDDYSIWLDRQTQGRIAPSLARLGGNGLITEPWTHDESLHNSYWTTEAALNMLETRDPTRPFFLNLAYHRPHPPFDPPVEYWNRYRDIDLPNLPVGDWALERFDRPTRRTDAEAGRLHPRQLDRARRGYYASITHVDAQIGRVLSWLRKRQMLDNTLIMFSSDHGEQLGDHLLYRKSTPLHGSMGVPMIIRPPRSWQAPRDARCDVPVALHDVMPTLLEAAGLPIPQTVEGRSFLALARGGSDDQFDRPFVHSEQSHSPLGPWQCLTGRTQKYIWLSRSGEELLFDRINDPQELNNLAGDAGCQDELDQWRSRLARVLADRPEDGMSDGEKLIPGQGLPMIRPWLKDWKLA
jgi:arylsulfatase A-like enzyme